MSRNYGGWRLTFGPSFHPSSGPGLGGFGHCLEGFGHGFGDFNLSFCLRLGTHDNGC